VSALARAPAIEAEPDQSEAQDQRRDQHIISFS
jgi:hypothetical protein